MWKGRFQSETALVLKQYSESISFDWRMFRHDIAGSIAHATALEKAGILTASERAEIEHGLHAIETEIANGTFVFDEALEDIHMSIEAALTLKIGAAGAKLHTARSRNDQVALDLRLYLREAVDLLIQGVRHLQRRLLELAERHQSTLLPGYTHLQRAQPVPFAHHLLAYVEMLDRDAGRLTDARTRMNVLPLGSGAIAGSTIPLDRALLAELLDFPAVTRNSMDAVCDRDFAVEILAALAVLGMHLSRLSEDVILWASREFGFVTLSDAYSTGSSLMPQKKNPDVAELTRGKTGRLYGNLVSLLTTLKGLPMTYNRDLQEDKEAIFDSVDTAAIALEVFAGMISEMEIIVDRCREAASDPALLATDLADHLVLKGMPFRQAHEVIGKLVHLANTRHVGLDALTEEDYNCASPLFENAVPTLLDPLRSMRARTAVGAPAPENVAAEIARWKGVLPPVS